MARYEASAAPGGAFAFPPSMAVIPGQARDDSVLSAIPALARGWQFINVSCGGLS
jgi:hypothetical protein